MALTRPIQREPKSSDEKQEDALFRRRQRNSSRVVPGPLVSNSLGNGLAGTKLGGGGRITGGNPGPVGGSTMPATYDAAPK